VVFAVPRQVSDLGDNDDNNNNDDDEEMEGDVEFIQPPPKKKSKSSPTQHNTMEHACIKCHWRKRNSECQSRMCLSCCVESGWQCNQCSHLAAKSSKDAILFLEHEIETERKPKAQPQPKVMVHTPHTHPDITAFLQQQGTTTTTVFSAKDCTTLPSTIQHVHSSLYPPSPPFAYTEPSNLHTFLASIQFQQYLPILISNGFETMTAIATS
jgi:hypothetical protein